MDLIHLLLLVPKVRDFYRDLRDPHFERMYVCVCVFKFQGHRVYFSIFIYQRNLLSTEIYKHKRLLFTNAI